MAHIIVETNFDRPISDAELMDVGNKLKPCVEERHGKRLRSYRAASSCDQAGMREADHSGLLRGLVLGDAAHPASR